MKLLDVKDLTVSFKNEKDYTAVVNNISYFVLPREIVGIIGESGCGKTVSVMNIMGLLNNNRECSVQGKIFFEGENILKANENRLSNIRGNHISMIFQDPAAYLNPVFTIGNQLIEQIVRHRGISKRKAASIAIDMLKLVEFPMAEKRINEYPHKLSGGMKQRVLIAMAVSCNPKLIIADEPTTSLDVTIQGQIIDLLTKIKEEMNTSIILITHDFALVSEAADYILIMYCGRIVERGSCIDIFKNPSHPYTKGLIDAIPTSDNVMKLIEIKGSPPDPANLPEGCTFHPRCKFRMNICKMDYPPEIKIEKGHYANCWLFGKNLK